MNLFDLPTNIHHFSEPSIKENILVINIDYVEKYDGRINEVFDSCYV